MSQSPTITGIYPPVPTFFDEREDLDLPPATLSAHLTVLRSAGLVLDQREGRVIRVRANYERMNDLSIGKKQKQHEASVDG